MGIGRMTIILGHMWLVEHNPKIDWSTGKVSMTRCPMACGPNVTADNPNQSKLGAADYLAGSLAGSPREKSCQKVHIEEVPEGQSETSKTEPLPGFACPYPDNLDR